MLDSVESVYYKKAAQIYLMLLIVDRALSSRSLSFFDKKDPEFALKPDIRPWSLAEVHETR